VAASAELAPADRRLYAIRDLSGTVDSVPLITSSILSKKLAAGIDTLLLDIKLGQGALLRSADEAESLSATLLQVAAALGLRAEVALSDMNQPLADAAGNALELRAAARVLRGEDRASRLYRLSLQLCERLLLRSGLCGSPEQVRFQLQRALNSGAAAERFEAMVVAMGGPPGCLDALPRLLPVAPCVGDVGAAQDGYIDSIDTRAIGEACLQLGAGRRGAGEAIDPRVGVSDILEAGRHVARGQPLLRVHAADACALAQARARLAAAFAIRATAPVLTPLLLGFRECRTAGAPA
jgi:thymidine phosphorylase